MSGAGKAGLSRALHEAWEKGREGLLADRAVFSGMLRKANGAGEHLLALEMAEAALPTCGGDEAVIVLQQKARALAALGSTQEARQVLEALTKAHPGNSEALGMLGRVYKDLAAAAAGAGDKRQWLEEGRRCYAAGFESARGKGDRGGAEYCGINAAAMSALLDEGQVAEDLARATLEHAGASDDYYSIATQAEAALILKREQEAADLYGQAFALAERNGNWGDLASTKKQCRALSSKLYGQRGRFEASFPNRTVAVFSGPRTGDAERGEPWLPDGAEESLKQRIGEWLAVRQVRASFSSAAPGADILFLEVAQAAGMETHIVLPFPVENYIEAMVRPAGDPWLARFSRVLAEAASLTVLNDAVAGEHGSVFSFCTSMIAARAALHGKALDMAKAALAVWDRRPGRSATADAVACWCRAKLPVYVVHPCEAAQDGDVSGVVSEEMARGTAPFDRLDTALPTGSETRVCSVLHLYFAAYFSLREGQYQEFQEKILDTVAAVIAVTSYPPESRYGLGPDYVFVFESERAAGLFADEVLQAVRKAVEGADGLELELPRLCLHAGPVQLMVNPVLNQYSHEGETMTRAGRVVRHVAPGVPYCTETFASLTALEEAREFGFEYAGTVTCGEQSDRLFRLRFD